MLVGTGYDNQENSFESGKNAASEALKNAGITHPDFVFSFCAGLVDHAELYRGIRSVLGDDVPIIGGSAIGIMTNEKLSYEGQPAGVAVIQDESLRFKVAAAGSVDHDELSAGMNIGQQLVPFDESKPLFLFYDSLKIPASSTNPPVMNSSSPLIRGINEAMGKNLPILGAGLLGNFEFTRSKQICGTYVGEQCAVGAQLTGDFNIRHCIMHGCTPLDGIYHTITKMEKNVIYEIDHEPVVELIDTLYGHKEWRTQLPVELLSIGVNHGIRFDPPRESYYVNRIITGVLPGDEGIAMFESDLDEGTEIQFMLRDSVEIVNSARKNTNELFASIDIEGEQVVFGFYLDCAGRTAKLSNTIIEEAEEVQSVFRERRIPLLGIYTGVEIAPLLGMSRGLDWTGVLIIFTKDKEQ